MAAALLLSKWLCTVESIEFGGPWLSCPCLLVADEFELLSLSSMIRVSGRGHEVTPVRHSHKVSSFDSGYWQPCNVFLHIVEWRGRGYGRADLVGEG